MENIVETKQCKQCNIQFHITDKDLEFYNKVSPVFNGIKYSIPSPTLCPDCRQQRRLAWRNERNLYKRQCDFNGQEIISMYPPDSPFKIYEQNIWWSDKWDAIQYGRDFDFSRNFFEQFRELQLEVPRVALINKQSENSKYTNHSSKNKNCYLSSVTFNSEDIYYSDWVVDHCIDCVDCSYILKGSELCYETYYSWGSYQALFCDFIKRCENIYFCFDCINCQNCFMCSNLRNKKYCIRNKQYTKEEYDNEIKKIFPLSYTLLKQLKNEYIQMKQAIAIHPFHYVLETIDSTGDLLFNTKNCTECYDCMDMEDCRYSIDAIDVRDSLDIYHVGWSELMYEAHAISKAYNLICCHFTYDNRNCICCDCTQNSSNLFGCAGLNQKEYCILNKQYTKEEYFELVPKIIEHMQKTGEWGEFFPIIFSPFAYNQSRAQEYYPLTKEQSLDKNITWSDYEMPLPQVEKVLEISQIPEYIQEISDDILKFGIKCEVTGRPFVIIKQELDFYRKMGLPLPRRHPDQRYWDRFQQRPPRKLWDRNCRKCNKEIKTNYSSDRPEIVYCEECYLKEVY